MVFYSDFVAVAIYMFVAFNGSVPFVSLPVEKYYIEDLKSAFNE